MFKPTQLKESNGTLPQLGNAPVIRLVQNDVECFIIAYIPSKKDLKAIADGQPIILQVYKEVTPHLLYTLDKSGKPNI